MPQLMAAVVIGAGIAAGVKWIMKEVLRTVEDARFSNDDLNRAEPLNIVTKDLGRLEWDAEKGVYRPADRRRG